MSDVNTITNDKEQEYAEACAAYVATCQYVMQEQLVERRKASDQLFDTLQSRIQADTESRTNGECIEKFGEDVTFDSRQMKARIHERDYDLCLIPRNTLVDLHKLNKDDGSMIDTRDVEKVLFSNTSSSSKKQKVDTISTLTADELRQQNAAL